MKKLAKMLSVGAFSVGVAFSSLSCVTAPLSSYRNTFMPLESQVIAYEFRTSNDGKLTFQKFSEFVRMVGDFYTKIDEREHNGALYIYDNHPKHGKVMILEGSYKFVDFRAYDGAKENKLDGNPDFIDWKFVNNEEWRTYIVPDGTTPPWPFSNVLENATAFEFELLRALKKEFEYEVYMEE